MNEFRLPGVIHFGWGAVEKVGEEAARLGRRALLVTGRTAMKRTGAADRLRTVLSDAGVESVLFDQVESDPSGTTIDRGGKTAREEGCDLVVGLGGGSPMDAARAIAGMAVLDGSIIDYLRGKPIDRPGLPLINIATTAGTASEITPFSVVLDEERKLKMGLKSPYWFSRVAVTDPELTMTMPPALTAATGLDALTHAIESYISTGATPPSEGLSLRAVALIGANLRSAFADGNNRAAREGMAMGSMVAGMAFANAGLGLVHGLVHPLGARHGVAGVACAPPAEWPGLNQELVGPLPHQLHRLGGVHLGELSSTLRHDCLQVLGAHHRAVAAVSRSVADLGADRGVPHKVLPSGAYVDLSGLPP